MFKQNKYIKRMLIALIIVTFVFRILCVVIRNDLGYTDWDGIAAFGTWLGFVISSFISIYIYTKTQETDARQIELQQNLAEKELQAASLQHKIDSFDLRYKTYGCLNELISTTTFLRRLYSPQEVKNLSDHTIPLLYSGWVEANIFNNPVHPKAYALHLEIRQKEMQVDSLRRSTANKSNTMKSTLLIEELRQQLAQLQVEKLITGLNEVKDELLPLKIADLLFSNDLANSIMTFQNCYTDFLAALLDETKRQELDSFKSKEADNLFNALSQLENNKILDKLKQIIKIDSVGSPTSSIKTGE